MKSSLMNGTFKSCKSVLNYGQWISSGWLWNMWQSWSSRQANIVHTFASCVSKSMISLATLCMLSPPSRRPTSMIYFSYAPNICKIIHNITRNTRMIKWSLEQILRGWFLNKGELPIDLETMARIDTATRAGADPGLCYRGSNLGAAEGARI